MSDDIPDAVTPGDELDRAYEHGRRVAFAESAGLMATMVQEAMSPDHAIGDARAAIHDLFKEITGQLLAWAEASLGPDPDPDQADEFDQEEWDFSYECGWFNALEKAAEAAALGSARVMVADDLGLSGSQRVAVRDSLRAFAEMYLRWAGTDPLDLEPDADE